MDGKRSPRRGEIWYVRLPTDPAEKNPRLVVIVSVDERNGHPRADTVLVAPLTTSVHKDVPTHVYLSAGETGLDPSSIRAEDLTVVRKSSLIEPTRKLRLLSNARICQVANAVQVAMGCKSW